MPAGFSSPQVLPEFSLAAYIARFLDTRLWQFFVDRYVIARNFVQRTLGQAPVSVKPQHAAPTNVTYMDIPALWQRQELPFLPDSAFHIPKEIPYGYIYYIRKGPQVGMGTTAFIDRNESGNIVKYPKPNPYCPEEEASRRRDMETEAHVYERIGRNALIPELVGWDKESCCLILEYLPNGNLASYLNDTATGNTTKYVDDALRERWTVQAATALGVLHAVDVIHCDFVPRNLLLDAKLNLRIADFAGSSVAGSDPTVTTGPRFQPPGWNWQRKAEKRDDIFALGSVLYFIMVGKEPYADLDEEEVELLFGKGNFPQVTGLRCGHIIQSCWTGAFTDTDQVATSLKDLNR